MYPLNDGELLAKTQQYVLIRKDREFTIEVNELISGESSHGYKFQACLIPISNGFVPKEYDGFADTHEKALAECLEKIKNVDDETIMNWIVRPLTEEQLEEMRT